MQPYIYYSVRESPKCKYDELTFFLAFVYICRETEKGDEASSLISSPTRSPTNKAKPDPWVLLEGFWLIVSSPYLLAVSLFLWLSAVVSSFFYFQVVIYFYSVSPFLIFVNTALDVHRIGNMCAY